MSSIKKHSAFLDLRVNGPLRIVAGEYKRLVIDEMRTAGFRLDNAKVKNLLDAEDDSVHICRTSISAGELEHLLLPDNPQTEVYITGLRCQIHSDQRDNDRLISCMFRTPGMPKIRDRYNPQGRAIKTIEQCTFSDRAYTYEGFADMNALYAAYQEHLRIEVREKQLKADKERARLERQLKKTEKPAEEKPL